MFSFPSFNIRIDPKILSQRVGGTLYKHQDSGDVGGTPGTPFRKHQDKYPTHIGILNIRIRLKFTQLLKLFGKGSLLLCQLQLDLITKALWKGV
jgi:hypothetical protein